MAAALLTFVSSPIPNPNHTLPSSRLRFGASRPARRLGLVRGLRSNPKRCLLLASDRRIARLVTFAAAHEESKHSDIEVEEEKNDLQSEADGSQEAWKQTLETFKEEALKMKEISQEAYEVYSKKAIIVLKETAETLKIQADKAREDLSIIAKEISEEGKVYLTTAAKNSPDSVKDIVETFSTSTDDVKDVSAIRDFYLGIPYGSFLAVGGFLSFMLTGSISAIRFGVILGSALLALSVSSLRSWKRGESSELYLKGQTAIATVIFLREWRLLCQRRSFSTSLMVLISGGMLAFYVYRIMLNSGNKGPSLDHKSES